MADPLNSRLSYVLNHCVDPERAKYIFVDDGDTCLPLIPGADLRGIHPAYTVMQWADIPVNWPAWRVNHICHQGGMRRCVNPYHMLLAKELDSPKRQQLCWGDAEVWADWEHPEYPDRLQLFVACLSGDIAPLAKVVSLDEYREEHAETEEAARIKFKERPKTTTLGKWERRTVHTPFAEGGGGAHS